MFRTPLLCAGFFSCILLAGLTQSFGQSKNNHQYGVVLTKHETYRQTTREQSEKDSLENLIRNLEQQRLSAGVTKDVNFYEANTADDYRQIDIEGKILDKQAMLQRIRSGYAQLKSLTADSIVVKVYGDVAVLTGIAEPKGSMQGKSFTDKMRYTRVYVKQDNDWKVVLFQQTRIQKNSTNRLTR